MPVWLRGAVAAALVPSLTLAQGDGTFEGEESVVVNLPVITVATGDFDGDGRPDLAASDGSRITGVFLQDAQDPRRWIPGARLTAGGFHLRVADFNRDGLEDIVAPHGGFLAAAGGGAFQQPRAISSIESARWLAAGDWNGDGLLDLASANQSRYEIVVFLGQGDGRFEVLKRYGTIGQPHAIEALDHDADGRLDLVVGMSESGLQLFRNRGDGEFQPGPVSAEFVNPRCLLAGDMDGDGRGDFLSCQGQLSVGLSRGDGTFRKVYLWPFALAGALGDLNGDRALDVAALPEARRLELRAGNGDGSLQPAAAFTVQVNPAISSWLSATARDLDGDGLCDLVLGASGEQRLLI
ncbi:MAG: FG-GAP repeat domain-containing protein, partial [Thermoanaerobaculia bacterium]